jgi:hypothetical protein
VKLLQHQLQLRKSILVGLVLIISVLNLTTVSGQNWEWAKSIVKNNTVTPTSVCLDDEANLYVSGESFGRSYCHFGEDSLNQYWILGSYVTRIDSDGEFKWAVVGGASNNYEGNSSVVYYNPHADSILVHSRFWGGDHRIGDCFLAEGGTYSHGGDGGPWYHHATYHGKDDGGCTKIQGGFVRSNLQFDDNRSAYGIIYSDYSWAVYDTGYYLVKQDAIDFSKKWAKQVLYDRQYGGIGRLEYTKESIYLSGTLGESDTTLFADTFLVSAPWSQFISKFDTSGALVWVKVIDRINSSVISSLESDDSGNLYISGSFYDSILIGDTTFYSPDPASWYVSKFDPNGKMLWWNQINLSDGELGFPQISTDREGNSYLAGEFIGRFEMNQFTLEANDKSMGVLSKFDKDGKCLGVLIYNESSTYPSYNVIPLVDNLGNCYVVGEFKGLVEFGNLHLTSSTAPSYSSVPYSTNTFIAKANFDNTSWETALTREEGLLILPNPTGSIATVQVPSALIGQKDYR